MFVYLLKLIGALLGIFLIVPGIVLLSTQSLRQTWEATKGYAAVTGLLIVLPMLLGALIMLFGMPVIG